MKLLRKIWMLLRDPTAEVITAEESADTLYEMQRMSQTAGEKIREQKNRVSDVASAARDRLRLIAEQANKAADDFREDDYRDVWL